MGIYITNMQHFDHRFLDLMMFHMLFIEVFSRYLLWLNHTRKVKMWCEHTLGVTKKGISIGLFSFISLLTGGDFIRTPLMVGRAEQVEDESDLWSRLRIWVSSKFWITQSNWSFPVTHEHAGVPVKKIGSSDAIFGPR